MTVISVLLVAGFMFMTMSSPFIIAVLFVATLLLSSLVVGSADSFLGFIVFVVYVGGALVLFSYCFMLTPLQDTSSLFPLSCLPLMFISASVPACGHGSLYEFYWVSSLLVSVGVLLFVVIVCVVSLVDFAQGSIRVL